MTTFPFWPLSRLRVIELGAAIAAHGGEAATVIGNYNALSAAQKQNILNFLRSL
ncbi:MAG: hypothetical protein HY261_05535 [Chloroflexi bacterium]|nr:hypothetical protein [Chloroflexota bacterium]